MFFSPQIVCVEATWVFALLPFQIRKSGETRYGASLIVLLTVLGLFAFESDGALRSRFTAVYEALVALVWSNAVLGISLEYQPTNRIEIPPSLHLRSRDHCTSASHAILVRSGDMDARHRLQPVSIPLPSLAHLRFPIRCQVFSRNCGRVPTRCACCRH